MKVFAITFLSALFVNAAWAGCTGLNLELLGQQGVVVAAPAAPAPSASKPCLIIRQQSQPLQQTQIIRQQSQPLQQTQIIRQQAPLLQQQMQTQSVVESLPLQPASARVPAPEKPKVIINKQPPIVVSRQAQKLVVKAGKPIIVEPAPVTINRPKTVEVQPVVIEHTDSPIIVNKKIVRISRPIIKKYFVEKFSKTEPCPCNEKVIDNQPLPPVQTCPLHSSSQVILS